MTIPRLVLAALAASLVASAAVAQANWPTGGQRGLARLTVPPAAGGEVAPRPPPSAVKAPLPPAAPKTPALAPAAAGPAAAGLAAGGLALGAPIGLVAIGAAAAALVSGASTSTTGTR
jgi:hypothetical protein